MGQSSLEERVERRMGRLVRTRFLALLFRQFLGLHVLALRIVRAVLGIRRYIRLGCHILARSLLRLRPNLLRRLRWIHIRWPGTKARCALWRPRNYRLDLKRN